jgi:hypothetical protein
MVTLLQQLQPEEFRAIGVLEKQTDENGAQYVCWNSMAIKSLGELATRLPGLA